MKIILLTSCLHPIDFANVIRAGIQMNSSHQHYFVSLIKALNQDHSVSIYSLFPRTHIPNMIKSKRAFEKAIFYYTQPTTSSLLRGWRYRRSVLNGLRLIKEPYILMVDSTSKLLLNVAKSITLSTKIVIITNHPKYLEQIKPQFVRYFKNEVKSFDGYLCLTPSLNETFNLKNKPALILPGFAEARQVSSPHKRPYFFYSGSLDEKSGINVLLQSFIQLNRTDIDFIIAGHGHESTLVERLSLQHPNIRFLGLLDHQKVYQYQGNALLNIHARPLDEQRDKNSIPSKLFEYFSSGAPTMSTLHPFFFPRFAEDCEWIESNSSEAWTRQFINFLNGDRILAIEKAQRLRVKILKNYGIDKYISELTEFLNILDYPKASVR